MTLDLQRAQDYLQSLTLDRLFVEALGWNQPGGKVAIATRIFKHPYRARCLADCAAASVWEIKIGRTLPLTPRIRDRLYKTIGKTHPQPLLIFIDPKRTRSLWHWQQAWGEQWIAQNLVFICQQPATFWVARLVKLATYATLSTASTPVPLSLFPDLPAPDILAQLSADCEQQIQRLIAGMSGIPLGTNRRWYASLLLTRLMLVYLLQKQKLLDRQDVWYLHNHLGKSQQRGLDRYFKHFLLPLFHQGFSLPAIERSKDLEALIGDIPYLGNIFYNHPLEQQYPDLDIADSAFESILVWFGEPIWEEILNPWQSLAVAHLLEQQVIAQTTGSYPTHPLLIALSCDRTLYQYLLNQLSLPDSSNSLSLPPLPSSPPHPLTPATPNPDSPDFNDLLFQGKAEFCRALIQDILPQLHILDPACGAGTFLAAILQRLVELYSILIGHLHKLDDSQLQLWLSGLYEEHPRPLQSIYRRLLKNNLYGIDLLKPATEIAQLQLLQLLIATAANPADIEALPDLDFNIITGNSLVGLVRVDAAGFDRMGAGSDLALQGNLLQPLAADSYRAILAEKNISLEHYKSQTNLLGELKTIPAYAQLEFLKESIHHLNQKAQNKLNELLLNEFSQKLGIHFKETQLTDRPQRRLLTLADLELLYPFHWGYHFHDIIEQQGGFNLIISAPPWNSLKPSAEEFFDRFSDLAQRKNLNNKTFKTSKQALLDTDLELAEAWLFYQSQYSFITDYFYRAEQYTHQTPILNGKRQRTLLRLDWLFTEQCFNLLSSGGLCSLILPSEWETSPKASSLRNLLDRKTHPTFSTLLPTDSESGLPPFSLLSFHKLHE